MSHTLSVPPTFGVTVDRLARLLQVAGEFDIAAVAGFAAGARTLLTDRPGDVVVDLTDVRFIDAAGLGALVVLRNALRGTGAMRVQGVSPNADRVFRAGGLGELLPAVGEPRSRHPG